ncbi:hypothetical protein OCU04_002865 [Sclerotinia nivalis]|uniref:Uncharacterized protein n=1 Tax=Sclerotinia nivalis TaxID=352851 RepID=A0A9X0AUJ1_9HELO|nr:hypothetical protein OCU04_002865 [Sclerotinia nivalis]
MPEKSGWRLKANASLAFIIAGGYNSITFDKNNNVSAMVTLKTWVQVKSLQRFIHPSV